MCVTFLPTPHDNDNIILPPIHMTVLHLLFSKLVFLTNQILPLKLENYRTPLYDTVSQFGNGQSIQYLSGFFNTLIEQGLMWWSFSGEDWKERAFLLLQHVVHSGHRGHGEHWIPSMPCLSESISFQRSCWALSSCVTSSLIHTCFWHLCFAWSLNALLTTLHFYYYLNHCFSFYAFKILC